MGGAFGLTAKTPIQMFKYMGGSNPKIYVADNGVHREFCENCGTYLWSISHSKTEFEELSADPCTANMENKIRTSSGTSAPIGNSSLLTGEGT